MSVVHFEPINCYVIHNAGLYVFSASGVSLLQLTNNTKTAIVSRQHLILEEANILSAITIPGKLITVSSDGLITVRKEDVVTTISNRRFPRDVRGPYQLYYYDSDSTLLAAGRTVYSVPVSENSPPRALLQLSWPVLHYDNGVLVDQGGSVFKLSSSCCRQVGLLRPPRCCAISGELVYSASGSLVAVLDLKTGLLRTSSFGRPVLDLLADEQYLWLCLAGGRVLQVSDRPERTPRDPSLLVLALQHDCDELQKLQQEKRKEEERLQKLRAPEASWVLSPDGRCTQDAHGIGLRLAWEQEALLILHQE